MFHHFTGKNLSFVSQKEYTQLFLVFFWLFLPLEKMHSLILYIMDAEGLLTL